MSLAHVIECCVLGCRTVNEIKLYYVSEGRISSWDHGWVVKFHFRKEGASKVNTF